MSPKTVAYKVKAPSRSAIDNAATRYGWVRQKPKRRHLGHQDLAWTENNVTKRCAECGGFYETLAGNYEPHPQCPKQRKAAA